MSVIGRRWASPAWLCAVLCAWCCAGVFLPGMAGEDAVAGGRDDTATLEDLVRQWVALKGEAASEAQAWEDQRVWMDTRIGLLESERDQLQARVEEARRQKGGHEAARAALTAETAQATEELKQVGTALDLAESRARAWLDVIPVPLRETAAEAVDAMAANRHGETGEAAVVARRLQAVVAFYVELERLQGEVHHVQEVLSIEGAPRREMDVLYMGLAHGYAVAPGDAVAAVGRPGQGGGWEWQASSRDAMAIRRALKIHQKEMPAGLVPLPVHVPRLSDTGGVE